MPVRHFCASIHNTRTMKLLLIALLCIIFFHVTPSDSRAVDDHRKTKSDDEIFDALAKDLRRYADTMTIEVVKMEEPSAEEKARNTLNL